MPIRVLTCGMLELEDETISFPRYSPQYIARLVEEDELNPAKAVGKDKSKLPKKPSLEMKCMM